MITFLFPKVTTTVEKRIIKLYKSFSKSGAFYRGSHWLGGFSNPFYPSDNSESE